MDNRGNIVIYQTKDGKTSIDVKLENETVWLTQAQMADLKSTVRLLSNVIEHKQLPLCSFGSWRRTVYCINLMVRS